MFKVGDKVGRGTEQGEVELVDEKEIVGWGFSRKEVFTRIKWGDNHSQDYSDDQLAELRIFKIG